MLIEFSVTNFLSFKDKTTFSMEAGAIDELPLNMFESSAITRSKVKSKNLKSAVIYGANASGKTNFIQSIDLLKYLVTQSHNFQRGRFVSSVHNKFDSEGSKLPTEFDITFIQKNIRYNYGVKFIKNKIVEEYLYSWPRGTKREIFYRRDINKYSISDYGLSSEEYKIRHLNTLRTLDNVLFLSKSSMENDKEISKAYDWFDNLIVYYPNRVNTTKDYLKEDHSLAEKVVEYLKIADFSIEKIFFEREEKNIGEIPLAVRKQLFSEIGLEENISAENSFAIQAYKDKLFFYHSFINSNGDTELIEFSEKEESDGTITYFSMLGPIIKSLENGSLFIIDEIESHLHTLIVEFIISLFHSPVTNKNNAQLLFTTHNTMLLENKELFRRDQIWFTEKTSSGYSDLFSLIDFSVRKDLNYKNAYLEGRFGAIPKIKESIFYDNEGDFDNGQKCSSKK